MERTGPLLSRAQFLHLVGAALPAIVLTPTRMAGAQAGVDCRRRVATLLQAYDSQGAHRTASPVDSASGDWLRRVVEAAGITARLSPFAVDRVDVRTARIDADGRTIEGLPFFDGGFTGETGLVGRLGPGGSAADIGLVTLNRSALASDGRSLDGLRRQSVHRAIVAVTKGDTPGLLPSNAASYAQPYGVPVLQVGSQHEPVLARLAAAGSTATVVVAAARTPDRAFNVIATVPGQRNELQPVVVVTPRSGWSQCTAERGGGLACWTETVRMISTARPLRPLVFAALSGHEAGHRGFAAFAAEHAGLVASAHTWIYLGANIGAAGGRLNIQASDDRLDAAARGALDPTGRSIDRREPPGDPPLDEARDIHDAGGRYVAIAGTSPSFRSERDRWPAAVDVDAITRIADGVAALAATRAALP